MRPDMSHGVAHNDYRMHRRGCSTAYFFFLQKRSEIPWREQPETILAMKVLYLLLEDDRKAVAVCTKPGLLSEHSTLPMGSCLESGSAGTKV